MNKTNAIFNSAIVLYFIIALEILIMISTFAGFFYSMFNPVLLGIAKYPAMKWLSAFFLPNWWFRLRHGTDGSLYEGLSRAAAETDSLHEESIISKVAENLV